MKNAYFKIIICFYSLLSLGTADFGYSAPSYSAPSYNNANLADQVHTHHHYYHNSPSSYTAPSYNQPAYKPSYSAPSYQPSYSYGPPQSSYYAGQQYYAPNYAYRNPKSYEDEYLHINKKELTRSALLLGAGVLKGVVITGLINSANNGVTIGK